MPIGIGRAARIACSGNGGVGDVITFHLIQHASDPFPGRWIEAGVGHFHLRLGRAVWFFSYWR